MEEKFVETKYGKIDYLEIGKGEKTLLYLHGWAGNPGPAFKIAHYLKHKNWRVIAPYLPGHGGSFPVTGTFSFSGLVQAFTEFIEKLNLYGCVAIGHSVGGVTVYELANSGKKLIGKAVIIDGYNNFRHDNVLTLLPLIWSVLKQNGLARFLLRARSVKKIQASALIINNNLLKTLIPSKFKHDSLPENKYLFVWGKKDTITPEDEWIKLTGINKNRVVEFTGGHCWCTAHLGRVWPVISKFIYEN